MRKLRSLPTVAWVVIGVLGASILAPAAAVAATSLVGIVGSNGARAAVTSAGQLRTTEASPSSYREFYSSGPCDTVLTVPSKSGFIIKQVIVDNVTSSAVGPGNYVGLWVNNSTCVGPYFLDYNPPGTDTVSIPLEPGLALKPGTSLQVGQSGGVTADVWVLGYFVPAKDVPANTPAVAQHAKVANKP